MSIETLPSAVLRADLMRPPPRTKGPERRGSANPPAGALQLLGPLLLAHRRDVAPVLLFEQPARLRRSVQKQQAAGLRAGVLPGVRHSARHEGIGAGAADRHLVAAHKGDLASSTYATSSLS